MSTPANPNFMRLSWLIQRLQANVVSGQDPIISFEGPHGNLGVVLSFYLTPDGNELEIDIGPDESDDR